MIRESEERAGKTRSIVTWAPSGTGCHPPDSTAAGEGNSSTFTSSSPTNLDIPDPARLGGHPRRDLLAEVAKEPQDLLVQLAEFGHEGWRRGAPGQPVDILRVGVPGQRVSGTLDASGGQGLTRTCP